MSGGLVGGPLLELTVVDNGRVDTLLEPGDGARLGVARARGPVKGSTGAAAAWVLVERGTGSLAAGDAVADVEGRADVFSGPGWSALVPPRGEFALDGEVAATVVWRASDHDGEPRLIDPDGVAEEHRGEGTTARRVRTYVGAGPLIVGETLNPPGGWSSWPPHRHEHEEVYLYRFDPAHGFGVHVAYDDDGDRPVIVRDGDLERITAGWHPVVAAPGFTMYYLWALAGRTDTVETRVDPRYEEAS